MTCRVRGSGPSNPLFLFVAPSHVQVRDMPYAAHSGRRPCVAERSRLRGLISSWHSGPRNRCQPTVLAQTCYIYRHVPCPTFLSISAQATSPAPAQRVCATSPATQRLSTSLTRVSSVMLFRRTCCAKPGIIAASLASQQDHKDSPSC